MATERTLIASQLSCVRQHKTIFANLSFELKSGEALLIEGPNGSGKSSLLRLLTGLSSPAAGDIVWQGTSIQTLRSEYTDALHFIGHSNGIKLGLTVMENVQLAAHLTNGAHLPEVDHILAILQLAAEKNTPAKYLSAGQKRRIALAKLFLFPKLLWLLDEPLTALDHATQALFLAQLSSHLEQGGMAIISSHHPITLPKHTMPTLRLTSC